MVQMSLGASLFWKFEQRGRVKKGYTNLKANIDERACDSQRWSASNNPIIPVLIQTMRCNAWLHQPMGTEACLNSCQQSLAKSCFETGECAVRRRVMSTTTSVSTWRTFMAQTTVTKTWVRGAAWLYWLLEHINRYTLWRIMMICGLALPVHVSPNECCG